MTPEAWAAKGIRPYFTKIMSDKKVFASLQQTEHLIRADHDWIVEIMPAPGWVAVFDHGGADGFHALVGWALVETVWQGAGGPVIDREVVGLIKDGAEVIRAPQMESFLRYEYKPDLQR